jgi:outer membrane lipoprotein
VILGITGCQTIPSELELYSPDLELAQVMEQPEDYQGQQVRWGGTVVKVENANQTSRIEVLAYSLNNYARPIPGQPSQGRFIVDIEGFIDPLVYTQGREVTVTGSVTGGQNGLIGGFDYRYPVIKGETHKLWPPREEVEIVPVYRHWHEPWYPFHDYYIYRYPRQLIK